MSTVAVIRRGGCDGKISFGTARSEMLRCDDGISRK